MSLPITFQAFIRFATGPAFGNVIVLGDSASPLGTGVLGTQAARPIDVTAYVQQASVRRGRTRILDQFDSGSATIVLRDLDGTFDPDNGTYAGQLLPMRQVQLRGTYSGVTRNLFSGFIESIDYQYENGADIGYVTITAVDTFRLLNLTNIDTITGAVTGERTDQRINAIFDEVSWPASLRNLDVGDSTIAADPGGTRSILDAVNAVADVELGAFYITPTGVARFVSRNNTIKDGSGTPTEFTDTGVGVGYQGIQFAHDEALLANVVTVQRSGGTAQTVSDATSIDTYFERSLERTDLLLETDGEALNQARSLLAAKKDAQLRIESIELDLGQDNAARINAALNTDFFDPIKVTRTQPGGGTVTRSLTVQGIDHDIAPNSWRTTFSTAEQVVRGFILNSTIAGVLGDDVLAY